MKFGMQRVAAPSIRPVSASELKDWGKIDTTDDDALIEGLLDAAIQHFDAWGGIVGRAYITQTWDLTLDAFPCGDAAIRLPLPPLQSVTSITYVDSAGVAQTLAAAGYRVTSAYEPALIEPAYGSSWPNVQAVRGAVTVRFVCGYATPAAVPEPLRLAVIALALHWYENRVPVRIGNIVNPIPLHVDRMIDAYRFQL